MKCPHCSTTEHRVLETRLFRGTEIRRRRECQGCKARFSTVETLLLNYPDIVKKDGRREPYSKEKLRRGIQIACKKLPISITEIEAAVSRISKEVQNCADKELKAEVLGRSVMRELKSLDNVAYVRFASVYKTFKDVNDFVESLEGFNPSAEEEDFLTAPPSSDSPPLPIEPS